MGLAQCMKRVATSTCTFEERLGSVHLSKQTGSGVRLCITTVVCDLQISYVTLEPFGLNFTFYIIVLIL